MQSETVVWGVRKGGSEERKKKKGEREERGRREEKEGEQEGRGLRIGREKRPNEIYTQDLPPKASYAGRDESKTTERSSRE